MKISGQNVPPELRLTYDKLVSKAIKAEVDATLVRTRQAAKKTKTARQRSTKQRSKIFARTIDALCRSHGIDPGHFSSAAFKAARMAELLNDAPSLTYWRSVDYIAQNYQTSTATSVPDPDPDPYIYRTQDNLPTIPTYGQGATAAAPLAYHGHTASGYFADDDITWLDRVFMLNEPLPPYDDAPLLMAVTTDFDVTTDRRASRTMFSLIYKCDYSTVEPDIDADPSPPLTKPRSIYYRYKPPLGSAPYYHATLRRLSTIVLPRPASAAGANFVRIRLAVRPLNGHANNNSTQVAITATVTLRLYAALPTGRSGRASAFTTTSGDLCYSNCGTDNALVWLSDPYPPPVATGEGCAAYPVSPTGYDLRYRSPAKTIEMPRSATLKVMGRFASGIMIMEYHQWDDQTQRYIGYLMTMRRNDNDAHLWAAAEYFTPLLDRSVIGPLSTTMLLADNGHAYNAAFGSECVPQIALAGTPPLLRTGYAYLQDNTGQWWEFTPPANRGGDITNPGATAPWPPARKIGQPVSRAARPFCTWEGIMFPNGQAAPGNYHLLTWAGALRTRTFSSAGLAEYIGQI